MAESSDDGYEIEKPPERRAPSSRASKGSRMGKLIAEEEEEAEEGDKDFYNQDFWAEADGDDEYADDADDEAAGDSFDSDFGDSTASDDDDDDDDDKAAKRSDAKAARKKSVYKDPKEKKAASAPNSISAGPKHHKRQRSGEAAALGAPAERTGRRASTQDHTVAQKARQQQEAERARAREQRRKELGLAKGVIEVRRLTQEEILAEARSTEIINRASLEKMQRLEEDKRKVVVRERDASGPRIKWVSKRQGDSVVNTLSFVNCEVPPEICAVAPPYPAPPRCAATGQAAKFFDPVTQTPYATLEAFQRLRGRTGRRSSWPTPNELPGTPAAGAPPEA